MSVDSGSSRTSSVWIDEKNGKKPWPARKVGWLVALPMMGLFTIGGTLWAVDHIEDQLVDEAHSDLEAAGIATSGLDIDFDYRDGDATGLLPVGVTTDQAEAAVSAGLLNDFDVDADVAAAPAPTTAAPAAVGSTDVSWTLADGAIVLRGEVASEAQRDALVDAATAEVGAAAVDDQLTVSGAEAPGDGDARIAALIAAATVAESADTITATLTDDTLDISGAVALQSDADAVTAAAAGAPVDGTVDLDIASSPVDVDARFESGVVTLTGTVIDEAQRTALVEAATALVGADAVDDQLTVHGGAAAVPGAADRVGALATAIGRWGGLDAAAGRLTDTGLEIDATGPIAAVSGVEALESDITALPTTVAATVVEDEPVVDVDTEIVELQSELDSLAAEIRENVTFATASDVLDDSAQATLDKVVAAMQRYSLPSVEVVGHTDDVGSADLNRELSAARAAAVVTYLVDAGVAIERLEARGAGPDEPVADNNTAEGRALNRRVEFSATS